MDENLIRPAVKYVANHKVTASLCSPEDVRGIERILARCALILRCGAIWSDTLVLETSEVIHRGSNPLISTKKWSDSKAAKSAVCKTAPNGFVGSSPTLTTIKYSNGAI